MDWSFEHGMTVRRIGAGPELVWIHGLGEWSVSFDPIARHPALAGFRHVLPDLPGYGRSPWPALGQGDSLERHADALAGWIGSRAPILVGHSMGGVLATMVAERIAVRAVVDVEGNLSRGDCRFSAQAAAYALDDFVARGFDAVRAQIHAQSAADPALRGYHAALTAASPEQFHRDAIALIAVSQAETLARRLAALACPALFVAGVPRGVCEHSRALLDREGARWLGIEPAGHWVWIDQPDAFAAAVAAFVTT
ncbi:MAG: alpha/beta fold hydrolase [Kofleriaceae bacterium]